MNVIDKIVNEWAFRCKKGYPDMNNPDDVKILKEIYSQYGIVMEEEKPQQQNNVSLEDLEKLINARKTELTQDQINNLYKIISKTGKGYTKSLLTVLEQTKKLNHQQALIVASYADKYHFEDKVLDSINNTANTFASLGSEGNLSTKLQDITGIDSTYVNAIIGLTVGAGQKSVGKGEIAVISFLHDTSSPKKGDVQTGEGVVEFKGKDAILAVAKHISRGYTADKILTDMAKVLEIPEDEVADFKKGGGVWTDKLIRYTQDKSQIQKVLDKFYKGAIKIGDADTTSVDAVRQQIAKELAKDYIKTINEPIFFFNDNRDYKIFRTQEDIAAAVGKDVFVTAFSDLVPRLSFTKAPTPVTEK
jgi:hypothetical protein